MKFGANLGASDYSGSARFGSTHCETTVWLSDSAITGCEPEYPQPSTLNPEP